ncbi:MAG: hypothetical protein NTY75_04055 [Candidatus Shapirobacteria bacterium]|nr:hypothetical protein [Candidatus Shapirobacteria bacterium]
MFIIVLLLAFFLNYSPILASDRNIFGLHLTQTSDLSISKDVINSSGGDWGWATIVVRLDQLDRNTWQNFMDNCRIYHIIPIIRLAIYMDQNNWKQPSLSDIDNLANFLNSLNWPTKTQYIIPFNEINHASEWGGAIDIKGFTDMFIYTSQKFKSLNPNFFVLSSPLDLASPENMPQFKSALNVYHEIYLYKPQFFDAFDGLASHSYPNHGFVGIPSDSGQHSVRGYIWELAYLKSLGINKTYPVFITETGWPHREGESNKNNFYTTATSAKFLSETLDIWQNDPRIMAVTPFIYNYPNVPFDHFSWVDKQEQLYPSYQQLIDKPKFKNTPEQITSFDVIENDMPFLIFSDYDYGGQIVLKNTGQSIWGETQFCLTPKSSDNVVVDALCTSNTFVPPGGKLTLNYKFRVAKSNEEKTFIGWDKVNQQYSITPIVTQGQIYRQDLNLKEKIIQLFKNLSL